MAVKVGTYFTYFFLGHEALKKNNTQQIWIAKVFLDCKVEYVKVRNQNWQQSILDSAYASSQLFEFINSKLSRKSKKLPEKLRRYALTKRNQEKTDRIIDIMDFIDIMYIIDIIEKLHIGRNAQNFKKFAWVSCKIAYHNVKSSCQN